jgi:hypothetical protein
MRTKIVGAESNKVSGRPTGQKSRSSGGGWRRPQVLGALLVPLALALAPGCDGVQGEESTVATAQTSEGITFDIRALKDGAFVLSQTGDMRHQPLDVPQSLLEDGDPVALFKHLAPRQQVPQSLVAAFERSVGMSTDPGAEVSSSEIPATVSRPKSSGFGQRSEALTTTSNWTGFDNCPTWWFRDQFCKGSLVGNDIIQPFCLTNETGVSVTQEQGIEGWGALCADQGVSLFSITVGNATESYTVDQGSWRKVFILAKRTCSFWTGCRDAKALIRFTLETLPDRPVGHLAAWIRR